jgi:hypothetical protein
MYKIENEFSIFVLGINIKIDRMIDEYVIVKIKNERILKVIKFLKKYKYLLILMKIIIKLIIVILIYLKYNY